MALSDFTHETIAVGVWFVKEEITQFRGVALRDMNSFESQQAET
jgi:hypothetical protein